MTRRSLLLVLAVAALGEVTLAQRRPSGAPQTAQFSADATAILVDVVVRDKRGHPIVQLSKDDFEVLEDGVPQKVGSFTAVSRATGIGIRVREKPRGGTTVTAPDLLDQSDVPADGSTANPTTSALVFDALTPEGLALAQRAALNELPMNGSTGARLAVFASEPVLRLLQPYTDDVGRVRQAVQRVSAAGSSRGEAAADRRAALSDRMRQLDAVSGVIGLESGAAFLTGGNNTTLAQSIVEMQMAQLEMRMSRTSEDLDRDHRGSGTIAALMTIIRSLAEENGRKTLVYFSEGLPASPALQAKMDAIVSAANRANVSVYTIDVAGLRAESTLQGTRREVEMAAEERLRQSASSRDPTSGPLTRIVERTEDLLRLDPQSGLARIAEDTGGFLIRDTNDLSNAFRRIDEDARFHYELTYSPSNQSFDGKFRRIEIRVKRDGAQVFSRKGYFAVRTASPMLGYEAPALAALDRAPLPNVFPIGAAALVFPGPTDRSVVPIVVQLRTSELEFRIDRDRDVYTGEATVVARLRNAAGQTVLTVSQQYILNGALKDLAAARQGEVLFYRQPELPAGSYTFEAVVHDAVADRASARVATVTVPPPSDKRMRASSLVVVERLERVTVDQRIVDAPLFYEDLVLYPSTGQPFSRSAQKEVPFYVAYHASASPDPPRGTLEVLQNGRVVAELPADLPQPVIGRRLQYLGRLPLSSLPYGTYELRLHLRQGEDEQVRHAFFSVKP